MYPFLWEGKVIELAIRDLLHKGVNQQVYDFPLFKADALRLEIWYSDWKHAQFCMHR